MALSPTKVSTFSYVWTTLIFSANFWWSCYYKLTSVALAAKQKWPYLPSTLIFLYIYLSGFRCKIPRCESDPILYNPEWISNAIPTEENRLALCTRYQLLNVSTSGVCTFNKTKTEPCNSFVYETDTRTILQDVSNARVNELLHSHYLICFSNF